MPSPRLVPIGQAPAPARPKPNGAQSRPERSEKHNGEENNPTAGIDAPRCISSEIDTKDPYTVARLFLDERAGGNGKPRNLVFWQGEFFRAGPSHWVLLTMDELRAESYPWLASKVVDGDKPVKPKMRIVAEIVDALKAVAQLPLKWAPPAWIDGDPNHPRPDELIPCRNGLLYIPTHKLFPPSRLFFSLNALDFDYDPLAPRPFMWLRFLADLWPNDQESIETLQEIFGLFLTLDTSHQKAFAIIGPPRSGKGTIARILANLVGMGNVTAPMLASLGREFGLEGFIGKTLALISDARLGGRADVAAIVENFLRITGEDAVSVPRKFRTDWTARIPVRFLILSNELPAFLDQSGALSSRFIMLRLTRSFLGSEDHGLTNRLMVELPGILLWALDGLERLQRRGHFVQPDSALDMVRQLDVLSSPVKAFVAERCVIEPGASVRIDWLFREWKAWAEEQGRDHAGTAAMLGRNLSSALPQLKVTRPWIDGKRQRCYEGMRLRSLNDPEPKDD